MADINSFKRIISAAPQGSTPKSQRESTDEADAQVGALAADVSTAQADVTNASAVLKQLQGVGQDNDDLQGAMRYLDAAAILMSRIIQRNVGR